MKKLKVFYNGRRLRDIYPHATPFQVLKWKIRTFLSALFRWTIVASVFMGIGALTTLAFSTSTIYASQPNITNLPEKIDELKDQVINEIAKCESGGAEEPDALLTYDPDKSGKKDRIASIGSMQYKIATIQHYVKLLDGKDLSKSDAIKLAMNGEQARELAKRIVFDTEKGSTNWTQCSKPLLGKIEVIKEL